ncbi:MAG: hypothetical protein J6A42_02850 [Firmicutes bacterium]|nr:hypothetical protein [Bacillota bacterium]MBQ1418906.1 hypothetical protein [Bacillota bacterium]MBQ1476192.1 hypothetical protein [Bacillota bacterium]MBQ2084054.1 hypothetical protein [Bacillota bacterium]MBQ2147888.1 hypothetical protein [Bacillota bacterium]
MYQDRVSHKQRNILLIVLCALVLACGYFAFSGSGKDLDEETVTAIRDAIRRSALQCYVVEGVYPPDLAYLQDHYGLQVNTDNYYVVYEAFASNVPPTINVIEK